MLTEMRDKISGLLAWIVVVIISIPFAFWGVNSYMEHQAEVVLAEGGGVKITERQLTRAIEQRADIVRRQFGPEQASTLLQSKPFKQEVLNGLMQERLLLRDSVDQGFRVSDNDLRRAIEGSDEFQKSGQFSKDLYLNTLSRMGISPSNYEASIRQSLAIQQLRRGFSASAIVDKADLNALLALKGQTREARYVRFSPESYTGSITVSDDEIKDWYDQHQDSYRNPETVQVDYLELSVPEMAKDIQPGEEKIKQYYQDNIAKFRSPGQRRASHILIAVNGTDEQAWEAAKAKADAIEKQLKDGGDMAELAKKDSDDAGSAAQGGDLGWFQRGVMTKPFEDAVFSMKEGEISEPVKSSYGYHIIKLTGVKPAETKPLEQVRQEVVAAVKKQEAENRFYEVSETLYNTVYEQPDSLQPAAEALGLKVKTSPWFPRSGGEGIFSNPKVLAAAFGEQVLTDNMNSDAIEVDNETLVAIHLKGHRPSSIKPLAEVGEQIRQELVLKDAAKQAAADGQALLKKLQSGADWSNELAQRGLGEEKTGSITRDQKLDFDGQLVRDIFRMSRPKESGVSYAGVDIGKQGFVVTRLEKVVDGDPATMTEVEKDDVRRQLEARRGREYFLDYQAGLIKSSDVKYELDKL